MVGWHAITPASYCKYSPVQGSYTMVTRFLFHGAPIIERKTRSNIVSPLLFSLHFEDDINSKFGRAYDKIRRYRFAHSFSILDQKPDRNANESTRTMERTTDVLSPSLSPQPSTRSIFYRITGIVASVPIRLYLPRGGHRSLSSLPLALPVNTIPRGLNIDCDSDL